MKDNKGFSLIELVVVVAILAVIGLAVVGFMGTGTNLFGSVSNEVDVQEEAQLTLNQISDMVTSSSRGVSYYYGDSETNVELSDSDVPEDVNRKTLVIYNTDYIYNIIWKADDKKIYLRKDAIDESGAITEGKESLMAEYVIAFSPSLKNAQQKNYITLKVTFKANKKEYTTSQNFTMRNRMIVNGSSDEIYEDKQEIQVTVTGIKLFYDGQECSNKSIMYMIQNSADSKGKVNFSATVQGTGFPSQEVIWSVQGASDTTNTKIEGGILTIGKNENSSSLIVSVASKLDSSISTDTTVAIKDITGITLSGPDINQKFKKGDSFRVDATVLGTNLTDSDRGIKWACTGATCINSTNTYAEFRITALAGQSVSVTATSTKKSSISNTYSGITVSDSNYEIKLNASSHYISPSGTNQVVITPEVSPNDGAYGEIEWEVVVYQIYDNGMQSDYPVDWIMIPNSWNDSGSWKFSYIINDGKCIIRCGPYVNSERYKIYVTAKLKNDNNITDQTSVEKRKS